MRIVMAAAEMVPFIKVGGLGDVVGALAKELGRMGHEVTVLIPGGDSENDPTLRGLPSVPIGEIAIRLGSRTETAQIEQSVLRDGQVRLMRIVHDGFFGRPNPYVDPQTGTDWPDNPDRFVFFCKAIAETILALDPPPEVAHLNDNHTGLVPLLLREAAGDHHAADRIGILFAIHNLGYQGIYPPSILDLIGGDLAERFFTPNGPLEFHGNVNFMKAAILYADLITTVSEHYAEEIQQDGEHGFGLEGILRARSKDVVGILNGIDVDIWDPEIDPVIPQHYSASNLGDKRENKLRLQQAMELPEDLNKPVIGMISRLVDQKGFDLVGEAAESLLGMDLMLVVLGNGDPRYEKMLRDLRDRYPQNFSVSLTFNDPLAHLIEAGSDFFLMPSRYEPCGLNQMYSLRYGTIPIVRATGGLADTVTEYDPATGRGNGFLFEEYTAEAMITAVRRGLAAYERKRAWKKLLSTVMRVDHSWKCAARAYVDAYSRAIASRSRPA